MSSRTPPALIRDLAEVGVHIADLWELVGAKVQCRPAVPVLLDWLEHVDLRVPASDRTKVREGLIRALTVPAARPAAAPLLIREFGAARDESSSYLRWVIGNALFVAADDSVFDEIEALARDRRYGTARQMIVLGLGHFKDPRTVPLLVELLADEDVTGHAVAALGRLKHLG